MLYWFEEDPPPPDKTSTCKCPSESVTTFLIVPDPSPAVFPNKAVCKWPTVLHLTSRLVAVLSSAINFVFNCPASFTCKTFDVPLPSPTVLPINGDFTCPLYYI